jgi:hypothetical protein
LIKFKSYNQLNKFVKKEYLPLIIQLVSGGLGGQLLGMLGMDVNA